ncbi:MAG: SpoIID/LytB domain-containing protein [Leptospira sp.]|nr:SpoIID/LytB domain-containing protein [Leptospira sp.]
MKPLKLLFLINFTALLLSFIGNCSTVIVRSWDPPHKSKPVDRVRVLLGKSNSDITLKTDGMIKVYDVNDLIIKKAIDSITIDSQNLRAKIRLSFEKNEFNFKGISYRGTAEIIPDSNGAMVVNIVPLETYLIAVVPSEMPANWPEEALKAQAVCARTYVVNEILNSGNRPYDVDATTNSQVYGGMEKENPRSDKAVNETKGILAVFDGYPIKSFFHSNSGGVTEKPENVWGGERLEYLASVKDDYSKTAKNFAWKETIPKNSMNEKLSSLGVGDIRDIQVLGRTPSGRVDLLEIDGSEKSVKVKGNDFRKLIGQTVVKSLRFGIKKDVDGFFIKGLGFGHGVGMSQWGSYGMARENYSYTDILQYYFKGIDLARVIEK